MEAIKRLSIKIRLYRTSLSITQQEMADKLGLSLRTFQRIETGHSPIDMNVLYKICNTYDIPFYDLVNPDVELTDLKEAYFFSEVDKFKEEFYFQDKANLFEIKDKVFKILEQDPSKLTEVMNLAEFENSPYYLFVSNLHFSIGNAKSRAVARLPDDKQRTIKTFKNSSIMIKSWDIFLKYNYPASKILSEHQTEKAQLKIMAYNFYSYQYINKDNPFIFGAYQLL